MKPNKMKRRVQWILVALIAVGLSSARAETGDVWTYDMSAAGGEGRIVSPDGVWSLPCDRTGARLDLYWSSGATGAGTLEMPTFAQEVVSLGGGLVRTNYWNVGLSERGFANCSNLVSVAIPAGVSSIGASAFDGCVSLRSVVVAAGGAVGSTVNLPVPEADTEEDSIITHCIGWSDADNAAIPRQTFVIGELGLDAQMSTLQFSRETGVGADAAYLFACGGMIESVTVPQTVGGVAVLGIDSLGGNEYLKEIEISEGVEEVADYAFSGCSSLMRVAFPSTVWYVGTGWYDGCDNLMQIGFAAGELAGQWVDLPVSGSGDTRLWGWNDKADGSGSWWGQSGLQSVPATGLTLYAVRTPTDFDFVQKENGIIVSHYGYREGPGETFAIDRMAGQQVVGLEDNALGELMGYTAVRIGSAVGFIGDFAFDGSLCETLTNIIFDAGAMAGKDVRVPVPADPEGMTFLGWRSSASGRDDIWSRYDESESQFTIRIPEEGGSFVAVFVSDEISWDEASDGVILQNYPIPEDATSFAIPESLSGRPVVGIGDSLLSGRDTLASVTIPDSVRTIAEGAFSDTAIWDESPEGLVVADGWIVGRKYDDETQVDTVIVGAEIRGLAENLFDYWSSLHHVSFAGTIRNEAVWLPDSERQGATFGGWCAMTDGSARFAVYDDEREMWKATLSGPIAYSALFHDDDVELEPVEDADTMRIVGWGYASSLFTVPTSYDGAVISEIGSEAFSDQGDLQELIVPEGIVGIGDGAFSFCGQLGSVRVSATVSSFGNRVFESCDSLSNVVFDAGAVSGQAIQLPIVADRENERFFGWRRKGAEPNVAWSRKVCDEESGMDVCLVTVPDGGATFEAVFVPDWIDWRELEDGIALTDYGLTDEMTSFTVPTELYGRPVTGVADGLFSSCSQLESISLHDGITYVGEGVFDETPLVTNVVAGFIVVDGWICGRQEEFFGRSSRIALPSGTVGIAERALADWQALRRVTFNEGLRVIAAGAFSGSGLTTASLPESVEVVAEDAFAECTSLRAISFSGSTLAGSRLRMPDPTASGMTLLGWHASGEDWDCWSEWEYAEEADCFYDVVEIPDVDGCAFSALFCTGNFYWETDGETESVIIVGSDSQAAKMTVPERICGGMVLALGSGAISDAESVSELTIPSSVDRVETSAISSCGHLAKVILESGNTLLTGGSIEGCPQLSEIVIGPGEEDHVAYLPYLEEDGDNRPVGWCAVTETGSVWSESINDPQTDSLCCRVRVPKEGATFKAVYDASGVTFEERGTALAITGWPTEDELPADLTVPSAIAGRPVVEICGGAFGDGTGVHRLTIAEGVELVDEMAFDGFYELEEINLPSSLWLLSEASFGDCPNLKKVAISDGEMAGQTICLPEMSREGETFVGWNESPDGTGEWFLNGASIVVPEGGITLNAVFAPYAADWYGTTDGVVIVQCDGYLSSEVVFDTFGGYPIVGVGTESELDDCEATSVRFGSSVKEMSESAIRGWMSVTNIEFAAGSLAGQRVWLPSYPDSQYDERNQTDCPFAWWQGVDGAGRKLYVPWTADAESGEEGYLLEIPDSGIRLEAVFLPDWIEVEADGDGLALNGYGVDDEATSFVVPSEIRDRPVTRIGQSLFASCSMLADVTIPESVRSIAEGAFDTTPMVDYAADELVYVDGWLVARRFDDEDSIVRLTVAEGTVGIADGALQGLPIRRIDLPSTLKYVGREAFGRTQLTSLDVPASLLSLHPLALTECGALRKVTIGGTGLAGTNLGLPVVEVSEEGKRFVGWSATLGEEEMWLDAVQYEDEENSCEICTGVLPDVPTVWCAQLADESFQWEACYDETGDTFLGVCLTGLAADGETVEIPEKIAGHTVVSIANSAVTAARATEVVVPSTSVSIEDGAFENCPYLAKITFKQGNGDVKVRMPYVDDFYGRRFVGWCTSPDGSGEWSQYDEYEEGYLVSVPDDGASYTAIWYEDDGLWDWVEDGNGVCLTYYGGDSADTLAIPDGIAGRAVVSIDENFWDGVDRNSLVELVLPVSLRELSDIGEWPRLRKVTMPYGLRDTSSTLTSPSFPECPNLDAFVITAAATEDETPWIIARSVRKVTFAEGVAVVNCPCSVSSYSAFNCLQDLQTVVLPATLTRIVSAEQFANAFEVGDGGGYYLGNWLVGYQKTSVDSTLAVREGTVGIADAALKGNAFCSEISLPASLKTVGAGAFAECTALSSVIFRGNAPVTYQDAYEFSGNSYSSVFTLVARSVFSGSPDDLLVSVDRESTGWNGDAEGLPATWPAFDGRRIAYLGTGGAAEVLLSLSVYPAGAGTVQGAGLYAVGSSVRIETTAADGYEFVGWAGSATDAESGVADMGACAVQTLSVREALTVVAVYRPVERLVFSSEAVAFTPSGASGGSALSVPGSWLVSKGFATEGVTSTRVAVAALNADGQNGIPVWQSYVLGLEPNESKPAEEQLMVSIDGFDAEGKPIITFSPNRSDDASVNAYLKYTTLGKEDLSAGEWLDVDAVENSGRKFRFFRVQATVAIP